MTKYHGMTFRVHTKYTTVLLEYKRVTFTVQYRKTCSLLPVTNFFFFILGQEILVRVSPQAGKMENKNLQTSTASIASWIFCNVFLALKRFSDFLNVEGFIHIIDLFFFFNFCDFYQILQNGPNIKLQIFISLRGFVEKIREAFQSWYYSIKNPWSNWAIARCSQSLLKIFFPSHYLRTNSLIIRSFNYWHWSTDPDVPTRGYRKEFNHWLVGNIPEDKVAKGEILAEYVGSGPPEGTGLHRYAFLLFKQNQGAITFDERRLSSR